MAPMIGHGSLNPKPLEFAVGEAGRDDCSSQPCGADYPVDNLFTFAVRERVIQGPYIIMEKNMETIIWVLKTLDS